jgi:hypothetical protein
VTREELISEMLRRNGQGTCLESHVARRYMGRVLDFVTLMQVGAPGGPVTPVGDSCLHTPPGMRARERETPPVASVGE